MKLKEKVSWLMGTVQRTLFPHLEECLDSPLTEQEKRLVKILGSLVFSGVQNYCIINYLCQQIDVAIS